MKDHGTDHDAYFQRLQSITWLGRIYKQHITSPYLYSRARRFGPRILEVGCGIGAGVLGAYPHTVAGADINPRAIEYCLAQGFNAHLIPADETWDIPSGSFDVCILDNVLEHVLNPSLLLRECARVTGQQGGLVMAVPGLKGFASDADHKVYYDDMALLHVDPDWICIHTTGMPLHIGRRMLSKLIRQFCFVAIYRKAANFALVKV